MKATQIVIDDILSMRGKIINSQFDSKISLIYSNSIQKISNVSELTFNFELAKKIISILATLSIKNNYNFMATPLSSNILFYLDEDNIIHKENIVVKTVDFEYVDDSHIESVLNSIFLKNTVLFHSLYVVNEDSNNIVYLRYEILNKNYLDISSINTFEIETIIDNSDVEQMKYDSKVPDFGNYSINKMKEIITNAGYNEIIHNQNKYKEINDNE